MPTMKFGQYKGIEISEVPQDYLEWMIRDSDEKLLMCKAEIERRKIKVEDSIMSKIVSEGFAAVTANSQSPTDLAKMKRARDLLMDAIHNAAQPKGNSP